MENLLSPSHRRRTPWQSLLLTAFLLAFWSPSTTTQPVIEAVPPDVLEGSHVLLLVHNLSPQELQGFHWYKGEGIDNSQQIATCILSRSQINDGPAKTSELTVYCNGTLLIQNVTTEYLGIYTLVTINNLLQTEETSVQFFVHPKLPKPFIDINGTEYVEGDDPVILTCEPETPNTTYQWKVNGQSLSGSDNDKLKLSNSNRTLTVFRVPSGETVTFQCKTQNPVSDGLSDPVTLSVLYGPDAPVISSPDSYLTPGADLHLTCNTTSNPDAQISWIVNGKTLQSTPELFIPKITTSSSGVYICLVHNPLTGLSKTAVKKITVSATEPVARPSIQASSTTVNEQDSLVLTCLSHDTGIAIRWIFNGQNLQLTETTKLSQDRSILTIDPVTKEDAGEYQCEVLTPVSSRESDPIVLAVNPNPDPNPDPNPTKVPPVNPSIPQ